MGGAFLAGALVAYAASRQLDVTPLVLFAAGNFIYIGASDLVPEIKTSPALSESLVALACFAVGVLSLLAVAVVLEP